MVSLSFGEGQDEGRFNGFPPHPSILLDGADKLHPLFSGRVSVSGLLTVLLVNYFLMADIFLRQCELTLDLQ